MGGDKMSRLALMCRDTEIVSVDPDAWRERSGIVRDHLALDPELARLAVDAPAATVRLLDQRVRGADTAACDAAGWVELVRAVGALHFCSSDEEGDDSWLWGPLTRMSTVERRQAALQLQHCAAFHELLEDCAWELAPYMTSADADWLAQVGPAGLELMLVSLHHMRQPVASNLGTHVRS